MILATRSANCAIALGENVKIFQADKLEYNSLELDNISKQENQITAMGYSKCESFLAICSQDKQLSIYRIENYQHCYKATLHRAASRIKFTPKLDLIVTDKSGDCYLYAKDTEKNEYKEPVLLLGHLSMLLDFAVSDCGKYIATCDRDEKIRVSSYPNSYNIVSYCLGHTQYICNVDFVSGSVLASASGDGTVRFWNYRKGQEVHSINTNDYLTQKHLVKDFCKEMDESLTCLPLSQMSVNREHDLLLVSLHQCQELQIYSFKVSDYVVETSLMQLIKFDNKLLYFSVANDNLYLLTNEDVLLYKFCENAFSHSLLKELNDFYRINALDSKKYEDNTINVLFKRKFDNVQEYLERKKLRLEQCK